MEVSEYKLSQLLIISLEFIVWFLMIISVDSDVGMVIMITVAFFIGIFITISLPTRIFPNIVEIEEIKELLSKK